MLFSFRPEDVPWLYYVNNADSVLGLSDISTEYSLKKNSIDNLIRMFVSRVTLIIPVISFTEHMLKYST